ncbi:unnamed protein product [Amoebophrya sp. A25]|nr:unnamed protein product [Amoebophrya sp. A25]|eukprot:GSA25T00010121001.1
MADGEGGGGNRRVAEPEVKIPIVRVKEQPRRHKVISFGYMVTIPEESDIPGEVRTVVPDVYKFQYPPVPEVPDDLVPGVIPANFQAGVEVDDTTVFFETKEGDNGPEYRVAYVHPENILLDWTDDVDALWIESLQILEDNRELSEEALDFLDADPLSLFGIADPVTQKALEKAATVPMLKCMGQRPVLEEWFAYLNADPEADKEFSWVVEAFAEVELPVPWTSYKGVGSIVCYLNNESQETTWKHPFYDYFSQLLDHCRRASQEEHIKLRLNRMLWTYEAESQHDVSLQQPLISPLYVQQIAEMLKIDLPKEPFMVRTLKTFLKAFSQQYRLEEEIDSQEVKWCLEIVENERAKAGIARNMDLEDDPGELVNPSAHAQLYCIECQVIATCYCPDCEDCFCENCFERLHSKGNRHKHEPNHLIPCCLCRAFPAKLQCTYTFGNYCHECYARKHVKTLPKFLDLKPLRIDYTARRKPDAGAAAGGSPASKAAPGAAAGAGPGGGAATSTAKPPGGPARVWALGEVNPAFEAQEGFSKRAPIQTTLGEEWSAFYDLRGVKYYYNFTTGESMRRPHERFIDIAVEKDALVVKDEEWTPEYKEVIRQMAVSKEGRKLGAFGTGIGPNA